MHSACLPAVHLSIHSIDRQHVRIVLMSVPGYLEAPGARDACLSQRRRPATSVLPPITLVFCAIDRLNELAAADALAEQLVNTVFASTLRVVSCADFTLTWQHAGIHVVSQHLLHTGCLKLPWTLSHMRAPGHTFLTPLAAAGAPGEGRL